MARKKKRAPKGRVFLDTGIFVAALDRSDHWHAAARALFATTSPFLPCTSLFVVSEAHSWFLHRLGEEPARTFQAFLAALPALTLFEGTKAVHASTLRMLDRMRGTKLTYVDASSLVLVEEHRIRTVWGTDPPLGITGADVVPRGLE
jgi:predicted nucleic acid-binding protein